MLLILKVARRVQVELLNFLRNLVDSLHLHGPVAVARGYMRGRLQRRLLLDPNCAGSITADGLDAGFAALERGLRKAHIEILSVVLLLDSLIMVG